MKDPLTGISKGFGLIYFESFESSDKCIAEMNGKMFSNK
jgi:RNA recognition motif-containing protein